MEPPTPPIVVDENGDLTIFNSVAEAEGHLEPVDVANDEYVAYDAKGRRLRLEIDPREKVRGFVVSNDYGVKIRLMEGQSSAEPALRSALLRFIRLAGLPEPDDLERAELATLISTARGPARRRR